MKTCMCVHVPTDLHCHVTTADELLVLEGRSVTFPCHYEPQYASYVKYWCQGRTREFCTSLARTSDAGAAKPGQKVSVVDHQVQQVFTVTMKNLTEADSGWYMCGVEIGGGWTADVASFVHIRVIHGERAEFINALNMRLHTTLICSARSVRPHQPAEWGGREQRFL